MTNENENAVDLDAVAELQALCRRLSEERSKAIREAIEAAIIKARSEARQLAEQTWDKEHGEQLQSASLRLKELHQKLNTASEYPIGTELVEWRKRFDGDVSTFRWELTGRRGVVEIITSESQHPSKRISQAKLGEFVIRLIRKNGEPSSDYGRFDNWDTRWLLSGATPK